MNYEIYTLPVIEAFQNKSSCPLCILKNKTETALLKYYLGDSIMNPETRMEVNRCGFCPEHNKKLLAGDNKNGLAIMQNSILLELFPRLKKQAEEIKSTLKRKSLFSKNLQKAKTSLMTSILSRPQNCLICRAMREDEKRYAETAAYLFNKNPDFKKLPGETGFCLPHLAGLLDFSAPAGSAETEYILCLLDCLIKLTEKHLENSGCFIRKFDYRNTDKPWNGAQNALPEITDFLGGNY
ncbi:MAG TPA: hypothetical protein DC049_16160 [Spirochaetia bacterium]|nr:hypothetical protein [Spirochaetia bacterium]